MRSATDRLLRILAPIVVLGGVAALIFGGKSGGPRAPDREETAIRARWANPSERDDVRAAVRTYLEKRPDDPEARWFAIEALARVMDPEGATATFEGSATLRAQPGAGRRFALLLLSHLDYEFGDRAKPTWVLGRCLQARIDAGDAAATEALGAIVAKAAPPDVLPLYGPIHRSPTAGADRLGEALLRRADAPEFFAAGATLLAKPGPSPQSERLRALLDSPWRAQRPFMWLHVARTLGLHGEPESLAALRAERDAVPDDLPGADIRRLSLDAALALGGDADAEARILAAIPSPGSDPAGVHYALGLGVLYRAGSPSAVPRIVECWRKSGGLMTHLQLAMSVLLGERDPEPDLPGSEWARDFAKSSSRMAKAVGRAYALRRGEAGAADALLAGIREDFATQKVTDMTTFDEDAPSAAVEGLRALARWGR